MKIKATKQKAKEALAKLAEAGNVSFNGELGGFSVKGVEGRFHYDEENEMLSVVIDDKPWLVSEEYIEDEIRKFFS